MTRQKVAFHVALFASLSVFCVSKGGPAWTPATPVDSTDLTKNVQVGTHNVPVASSNYSVMGVTQEYLGATEVEDVRYMLLRSTAGEVERMAGAFGLSPKHPVVSVIAILDAVPAPEGSNEPRAVVVAERLSSGLLRFVALRQPKAGTWSPIERLMVSESGTPDHNRLITYLLQVNAAATGSRFLTVMFIGVTATELIGKEASFGDQGPFDDTFDPQQDGWLAKPKDKGPNGCHHFELCRNLPGPACKGLEGKCTEKEKKDDKGC